MAPTMVAVLQTADAQQPPTFWWWFLFTAIKLILFFTAYMIGVALLTLAERKISAWIQDRHGPNRVGPGGLLQPAADGLKNIMKEETLPPYANRTMFMLAPALAFVPAMLTWSVIPFAAPLPVPHVGLIQMVIADLPIGFLFTLAISSLGVYGIVLAGWSSNNKYALLGGLRSSAQMISYEISMGMSTVAVLLLAGNVTFSAIVQQQASLGWNALLLTVAFLLFLVSAFAETNRLPFDLPEAESELIAGYHTEYSAMKFSLFFIAEYANMVTASALVSTLFFGGWDIPFTQWDNSAPWSVLKTVLTLIVFMTKVGFFLFFYMWIRWTLPRFRYDQLMSLGWKLFLPVTLAYIVIVASVTLALDAAGVRRGPGFGLFGLILFAVNVGCVILLFFILDRGRIVSPASQRARESERQRLRAMALRSTLITERTAGGGAD